MPQSDAEAIAEIESLQPFNNAEPTSDSLFALDELINIDKHRRLLIVATRNIGGCDGTTIAIGPPLVRQQKVRMQGKCIVYVALPEGAAKDIDFERFF